MVNYKKIKEIGYLLCFIGLFCGQLESFLQYGHPLAFLGWVFAFPVGAIMVAIGVWKER